MKPRLPLHALFVHFPVVLWTVATLLDLAASALPAPAPLIASYALIAGTAMALPALMTGLGEATRLPKGHPAWRATYLHLGLTALAFALYLACLLLRVADLAAAPTALAIVLSATGFAALSVGGHIGARLVYFAGVGVTRSSPEGSHR